MALYAKALGIVALGVGSVGFPVYLLQRVKGPALIAQEPSYVVSESTSQTSEVAKSVEKVSCEISSISQVSQDFASFLQGQKKDELYDLVSCSNAFVEGDYDSLLGKDWKGLFPKNVLSEKLSIKTKEKFGINVDTIREEGIPGTTIFVVFNNPQTSSSVRGKLSNISDENLSKKMIVVSVEDSKQTPKEIYLLVNSSNESTE